MYSQEFGEKDISLFPGCISLLLHKYFLKKQTGPLEMTDIGWKSLTQNSGSKNVNNSVGSKAVLNGREAVSALCFQFFNLKKKKKKADLC